MPEYQDQVVVLMPTYNEVQHIGAVVKAALQYVPAVIVIDDGSSDGSAAAAALAGAKVIAHPVNQGKGAALNTGFDYAASREVAAAITMDADGQHDPAELPKFLEAFQADLGDVIIGQRQFEQMPGIRQWGNRTGTRLLNWAMGEAVPDNQSGYRLLKREVLRTVRPRSTRFEAEVEILLRAKLAGFRIAWVPIRTIYADEVSHYRKIQDSILFLKMVWRIRQARRRGRFD